MEKFLAQEGLSHAGDQATLKERAWRLREALKTKDLINPELTTIQRRALLQVLLEHGLVFCCDKADLKTPALAEPMHIHTTEGGPKRARPYKAGPQERKVLQETVDGQLAAGVIQDSRSEWSSAAFVVYRK